MPFQDMHASEPPVFHAILQDRLSGRGCLAHCAYNMPEPVHAGMPERVEAGKQGPAQLKAPMITRSRHKTRGRRLPIGQASADTGRVAKRCAAQCEETADAPQPYDESDSLSSHQPPLEMLPSRDISRPTNSAAPGPAVAEAPAAARDPSANLTVCS